MRARAAVAVAAVIVLGACSGDDGPDLADGLAPAFADFTQPTVYGGCEIVDLITNEVKAVECWDTIPDTTSPTTTVPPTTAAPTTVPPTTAPTTTVPVTTTPTTTVPPVGGAPFVATFEGNVGLDLFDTGVYHRDDVLVAMTSWPGDHDLNCGTPDTTRTIQRSNPQDSFYLCRDHLMTSVGDTSGYSIAWFSPKQTFSAGEHTVVSWDVNVTDLGLRQWWEVAIIPEGAPHLASVDWIAAKANIDTYAPGTIVVGSGPYGGAGEVLTGDGVSQDPLGRSRINDIDPAGSTSKAIRRPFQITDNGDGTITVLFIDRTFTYAGEFPDRFKVYFKDHNYTPNKDNPASYTWHWDNIIVR